MSGVGLVRERRGHVLLLRLDRPEARNALTYALIGELGDTMAAAEHDPEVRAVVLTGTGDRAFCGGMDLKSLASGEPLPPPESMANFRRLLAGAFAIPLVGAANASALGGGLELLMGCDLVVASADASFGLPEVKRGLFPGGNGTTLGTRVPVAVAMEMVLTGDSITAARAAELGLVNLVVDPADVLPTALERAERIAANAPLAVAAARELVRLWRDDPAQAAERQLELQQLVFNSEDAREGAMAFAEKRSPEWQGR